MQNLQLYPVVPNTRRVWFSIRRPVERRPAHAVCARAGHVGTRRTAVHQRAGSRVYDAGASDATVAPFTERRL